MKKFYKWYWKNANKNKDGFDEVFVSVLLPTSLLLGWCTLWLIGSVWNSEDKGDDIALVGVVILGYFLATLTFWEGFPKPPKK